jgi:hypothetical protein
MSDHILATPEVTSEEVVSSKSRERLDKYIEGKKDFYGHSFKKESKYGFDYVSVTGGVKVKKYIPRIIKKI